MKRIASVLSGVFVVLAMAIPAEAQSSWDAECNSLDAQVRQSPRHLQRQMYEIARQCWSARYDQYNRQRAFEKDRMRVYDPYYGYGQQYNSQQFGGGMYGAGMYGRYYDSATIQQMMSLPDTLNSCQVDWSTGRVASCRSIVKTADAIMAFSQNPDGILTGIHVHRGKFHHRFLDDTNQRLGRGGAVAVGTAGGTVAGAVFGGRKGAVVGGGIGALAGWFTSRKFDRHDNCLIMEPAVAQSAGLLPSGGAPVSSNQEQVPTQPSPTPIAGPAVNATGEGEFTLENGTPFRLEVYYDGKYLDRMGLNASWKVGYPEKEKRYEAHMLVPNEEGGISSRPAKIVPGNNGLTFADPTSAGR